jgi:hypothetical protein
MCNGAKSFATYVMFVSSIAYAAADPAIYRPTEDSVMRLSREQGRPQSRQNAGHFLQ